MAGPADDRALGRGRSGGSARVGGAGGQGLSRCILSAGSQDQFVSEPATVDSGRPLAEKRNRLHREKMNNHLDLRSRAVAEFLGTAFLLAAVVGSGIMGERPCGGNVAVALLANTLSTGAILVV